MIQLPPQADETIDDLTTAGFAKSFDVHCGVAGARLIDFGWTEHGPVARLSHALRQLTDEGLFMHHYERELLAGHCVVVVVQTDGADRRQRAMEVLRAHGGHFMNQFGRWAVETVQP